MFFSAIFTYLAVDCGSTSWKYGKVNFEKEQNRDG